MHAFKVNKFFLNIIDNIKVQQLFEYRKISASVYRCAIRTKIMMNVPIVFV